jgi:hypothetical protein
VVDVPRPQSRRGRALASQRRDDNDGRFTERFIEFSYPAIAPLDSNTQRTQIQSMGARFVRILAIRATLLQTSDPLPTGVELATLLLRVQSGASNDLFVGAGVGLNTGRIVPNVVSFAAICSGSPDPWFWFMSAPRLPAGETLQATVTNGGFNETGAAPTLTPELTFRVMDDKLYKRLYEMELAAELDAAARYERGE